MANVEATDFEQPVGATASQTTTVTIPPGGVLADQINFLFNTPNGNRPNDNSNTVFLWQSGDEVPWVIDALDDQPVTASTPQGDASFQNLSVTEQSYILGYAVGPVQKDAEWSKYSNVVATAFIPAGGSGEYQYFSPSVATTYVGSTSLTGAFNFLSGFNPEAAGAWVGIWEGTSASYTRQPKWVAPIKTGKNKGSVSINKITITRGTSYTLGLFPTGYLDTGAAQPLKNLCAVFTFTP